MADPAPEAPHPAPKAAEARGGAGAARPREVVVEVKDLVVGYDDQVILNGINLSVVRGEVVVILGGSGSGKSTLLKAMLGIVPVRAGSVRVLGVDMARTTPYEREEVYKKVGIVYQGGALFGSMTAGDNVALPLREHSGLESTIIDIAVRMKLGLVGLSGFADRLPSQLSGGQRKRVALARAIAMDPQVLFADEPSAGLDPRIGRGIDDLIRNLNKAFDMAIVVVTHEMESVRVIADRIVMLSPEAGGAKVIFTGTYEDMAACQDPAVRSFMDRVPLKEPRAEAIEVLRNLVGRGG
jgi:phospholipid/cholesterol/gamma-HCH transport system ATP-binding protein